MSEYHRTGGRHNQLRTKKKKRNKGLIALLVVLLLAAGLLGVFAAFFHKYYGLAHYISDAAMARELAGAVTGEGSLTEEEVGALRAAAVAGGSEGAVSPLASKNVYNLLLVGVDRRDASWAGNSDAMILVSFNKKQKRTHMVSFMRDLYADIPGHGVNKLNAASAFGGCPLLVETIEQNYGVDIDNYISVDYGGLIAIVDALGGVQLEVSDAEADYANGLITDMASFLGGDASAHYFAGGGTCLCDGYQAVAYSRIRQIGNNDYERTGRQRTVMTKMMDKVRNMGIRELSDFALAALPELTHNIDPGSMLGLLVQIPTLMGYQTEEARVPFDGLYTSENEILVPDMTATTEKLRELLYG